MGNVLSAVEGKIEEAESRKKGKNKWGRLGNLFCCYIIK